MKATRNRNWRVCYFGTYRAEYSRNRILIEGLRRNGVEVLECHEPLWHGIEDRVRVASGAWAYPAFWYHLLSTYGRLLSRYWSIRQNYDVLVVGYPGQVDVFLARLLSWIQRKPLVWDIFMSIYLIALERGLAERSSFTVRMIRQLERVACRFPDLLILDTAEYVAWFEQTHGVPSNRFRLIPTGADTRLFRPISRQNVDDGIFRVIYYGTFIRNHAVEYIIEAARLLAGDQTIRFELIGEGPDREKAMEMTKTYRLKNVWFVDWMDQSELLTRVADADVCLGAFGTTPQSVMTIQNKIYEALAMAKPVLTGDAPAIRKVLKHGEHLYLCERANPQALAKALCLLRNDPELRRKLSANGYALCQQRFTIEQLGLQFKKYLLECV
ncbi:MAG: glycosyltransferase family 4 protein [Pseudomonadota bacterium]